MESTDNKSFCLAAIDLGYLSCSEMLDFLLERAALEPGGLVKQCLQQRLMTSAAIDAISEHVANQSLPPEEEGITVSAGCQKPVTTREPAPVGQSASGEAAALREDAVVSERNAETTGDGGAGQAMPPLPLVEQEGRYAYQEEVGHGGMGVVYSVMDHCMLRRVALKELLPEMVSDPSFRDMLAELKGRFVREAHLTGALQHPGIVPVYEFGHHHATGECYYTMKLVEGRTLAEAIAGAAGLDGRLELLPNFIDVCLTVAYAHSRSVIHRDLKPRNIIIGEFGETYVLDWGCAKVIGQSADIPADRQPAPSRLADGMIAEPVTQAGMTLGTPLYMSPEQVAGCFDEVDERSDIFSLGAILYEILTGLKPAGVSGRAFSRVPEDNRESAIEWRESPPPPLVAICERAMAVSPQRRFDSAADLAFALRHVQIGAEVVLEQLAERVHDAYVEERLSQGWRYGPERNDHKKENPTLVPYQALSEQEKEMDRVTAKRTIDALGELGFVVAREKRAVPIG